MDRFITDILIDALDNINNLQDYYNSQKKYVQNHVISNMEKYKYGIIMDRFFWNKTVDSEEFDISEKEQEIINEIISDYSIEEKDDACIVKYRLNPENDYSDYEMDPQIAKNEFVKLIQQPVILNESVFNILMDVYEEAISEIYRFLLETYPDEFLSDKSITYGELCLKDSSIEEIKERFIERETDLFMRLPLSERHNQIRADYKPDHFFDEDFEVFKELYYRRYVIILNKGIVNERYKKNVPYSNSEVGDCLGLDEEYMTKAFTVVGKILIGTIWGLKKTESDTKELNEFLFEYGYDCMKMGQWEIAEYIYGVLIKDKDQNEEDILFEKINMWIATKNRMGIDSIKTEVENLDVTDMQRQFVVAKHALLDDFDNVTVCLEEAIDTDIPAWYVEEWPLLKQYRESSQYADFLEKHRDLFETKGYEPNSETVGLTEEISSLYSMEGIHQ